MHDDTAADLRTRAGTGRDCTPDFVYTVYIRADVETVWNGLIDADLTRRYWGHVNQSSWQRGAAWEHLRADGSGKIDTRGRVVEIDPPRRMVWSWAFDADADQPEKLSRVTYELVPLGPDTKLTVTHAELEPGSAMDAGVREGWPAVLSNLKTILETGTVLREEDWPGQGQS